MAPRERAGPAQPPPCPPQVFAAESDEISSGAGSDVSPCTGGRETGHSAACAPGAAPAAHPDARAAAAEDPALFSDICSPGPRLPQQRPELDLAAMRAAEEVRTT